MLIYCGTSRSLTGRSLVAYEASRPIYLADGTCAVCLAKMALIFHRAQHVSSYLDLSYSSTVHEGCHPHSRSRLVGVQVNMFVWVVELLIHLDRAPSRRVSSIVRPEPNNIS
jgi:hypothetical protein